MLRVYISGAIAGRPEGNKEAFAAEGRWVASMDCQYVNPHTIPPWPRSNECPEGYATNNGHSSACYLRADLKELLQCDAMLMLEGWHGSKGAALEREVAKMCGIPIFENRAHFMAFYKISEQQELQAEIDEEFRAKNKFTIAAGYDTSEIVNWKGRGA